MTFIKSSVLVSLFSLVLISGCSEKGEESFKTVEYYKNNKEARETRKEECLTMTNITKTLSQDCANVDIAIRKTRPKSKLTDTSSWFQ